MFLLNSCLSLFTAACVRRHPFSRSYGAILPSSLTMLLPSALGFSPHPPVSVYGTGTVHTIAAFLGTELTCFSTLISIRVYLLAYKAGFLTLHLLVLHRFLLSRLMFTPCVPTFLILTQGRSALPWKPWIFGRKDSHLPLATHSGILSSHKSTAPFGTASLLCQCSSTAHAWHEP